MGKSVNTVTKALKLKANPKQQALTIRVGTKKYTLPFEVRTLNSDGFLFVHIPPAASIFKLSEGALVEVTSEADASAAQTSFRQRPKKKASRAPRAVEIPDELKALLAKLPSGHKLAYGADGQPRLVKTRKRSK